MRMELKFNTLCNLLIWSVETAILYTERGILKNYVL